MRSWRRPSVWVNAVLAVLVLAGGAWVYLSLRGHSTAEASDSATTRRATVSTGTVTATVSASGTVASANTAAANFTTSGTVTEVDAKVGDVVTKGQTLAKVDPAAAKETLTTAKANLQAAKDALSRVEADSTSDSSTISAAEAQVSSAQATVDADQRAVDGTVLTAPIAGTVTAVNGSVGNSSGGGSNGSSNSSSNSSSSSTSSSSGFIQIADLTQLQVSASFAESDATKLKVGQAANVTWSALSGARATGKVATISPTATVSGGVNSYAVVVSLDSVPDGVRIGQTTTVAVTVAEADNVLRVPLAAVRSAGGRHTVTVVGSNGTTSTVLIQVGVQGDSFDEVTSGLTNGQELEYTVKTSTGTTGTGGGGFGGAGDFPGGGTGGGPGGGAGPVGNLGGGG